MEALIYLIVLGLYGYIVYWTGNKAKERGRSQTNWIILSILFSFVATIILLNMPDLSKSQPAPAAATVGGGTPAPAPMPVAPPAPAAPAPLPAAPAAPAAPAPMPAAQAVVPAAPPPPAPAPVDPPATAPSAMAVSDDSEDEDRRPCPRCGESIAAAAKVCRFCGLDLSAPTPSS